MVSPQGINNGRYSKSVAEFAILELLGEQYRFLKRRNDAWKYYVHEKGVLKLTRKRNFSLSKKIYIYNINVIFCMIYLQYNYIVIQILREQDK